METASLATTLFFCMPLMAVTVEDQLSLGISNIKRDSLPSFGYKENTDKQASFRGAWIKALQKQITPRYNQITEEAKIPTWVNPWVSQPVESLPVKRSSIQNGRVPFRFRFYKDGKQDLEEGMQKRGLKTAQMFRFIPDVDMKRAEDKMFGLNSVPMMGKRMFQYLCQDCD